ncbi:hypothetical protein MMC31_003386 [Peltigera leucophlebia]|nr:hypothetical protein [Peltigera leucophlebia]
MRLQILALLCLLSVLVLATGKLEDKSDIEDVLNAWNLLFDAKKFVKAGELLTPNVTYVPGRPGLPVRRLKGVDAVVGYLKKIFPDNVPTYHLLSTKLIKFIPPFDKEGRSDRASAVSYSTVIAFGAGNSTEEFILALKFVDKEIVRTKEPEFGGWRIQNREIKLIVSFNSTITCATYHPPLPVVPKEIFRYVDPTNLQGHPIGNPAVLGE